jgi:arylformamidase
MNDSVDPFEIRRHVPRFEEHLRDYDVASEATRRRLPSKLNVAYGDGVDEKLDLFFPEFRDADAPLPIHMFVHGGYWRAQSKERYAFVADTIVEAGAIAALIDYTLMPRARMADLVDQTRRAARWLTTNAASFGGDCAAFSVSGHSAGGHLASYLLARGPHEVQTTRLVRSALLVSGLYDLAPIARSFLQPEIRLTQAEVAEWSPISSLPAADVRVTLVVGGDETAPFHQQMNAYAEILARAGVEVAKDTVRQEDHMTIVRSLGRSGADCANLLRETIKASRS